VRVELPQVGELVYQILEAAVFSLLLGLLPVFGQNLDEAEDYLLLGQVLGNQDCVLHCLARVFGTTDFVVVDLQHHVVSQVDLVDLVLAFVICVYDVEHAQLDCFAVFPPDVEILDGPHFFQEDGSFDEGEVLLFLGCHFAQVNGFCDLFGEQVDSLH